MTATVTVTPTVEPSNWPPRVRLDVSQSGTPAATSTTINRVNPDGSLVPVRTEDGNPLPLSPTGLAYDYEMPYQAAVSYTTVESPTVISAQVTVPEARIWLVHPGVPGLSTPIELRVGSLADESWPIAQTVYVVMGRTNPVVWTDGFRKGPQSTLIVAIDTPEDLAAVAAVLADGSDLLLNIPTALELGFTTSYIAVGVVTPSRPSTIGSDPLRDVTLPFQVVDRPVGGSQAQRTLADLMVYPTLAALKVAYPTLADLLAGP